MPERRVGGHRRSNPSNSLHLSVDGGGGEVICSSLVIHGDVLRNLTNHSHPSQITKIVQNHLKNVISGQTQPQSTHKSLHLCDIRKFANFGNSKISDFAAPQRPDYPEDPRSPKKTGKSGNCGALSDTWTIRHPSRVKVSGNGNMGFFEINSQLRAPYLTQELLNNLPQPLIKCEYLLSADRGASYR